MLHAGNAAHASAGCGRPASGLWHPAYLAQPRPGPSGTARPAVRTRSVLAQLEPLQPCPRAPQTWPSTSTPCATAAPPCTGARAALAWHPGCVPHGHPGTAGLDPPPEQQQELLRPSAGPCAGLWPRVRRTWCACCWSLAPTLLSAPGGRAASTPRLSTWRRVKSARQQGLGWDPALPHLWQQAQRLARLHGVPKPSWSCAPFLISACSGPAWAPAPALAPAGTTGRCWIRCLLTSRQTGCLPS